MTGREARLQRWTLIYQLALLCFVLLSLVHNPAVSFSTNGYFAPTDSRLKDATFSFAGQVTILNSLQPEAFEVTPQFCARKCAEYLGKCKSFVFIPKENRCDLQDMNGCDEHTIAYKLDYTTYSLRDSSAGEPSHTCLPRCVDVATCEECGRPNCRKEDDCHTCDYFCWTINQTNQDSNNNPVYDSYLVTAPISGQTYILCYGERNAFFANGRTYYYKELDRFKKMEVRVKTKIYNEKYTSYVGGSVTKDSVMVKSLVHASLGDGWYPYSVEKKLIRPTNRKCKRFFYSADPCPGEVPDDFQYRYYIWPNASLSPSDLSYNIYILILPEEYI